MEALIPVVWVAFIALFLVASYLSRRSQEEQLDLFRQLLQGGHGRTAVTWLGGLGDAFVKGRLDGRPVSLTFERRGSGKNEYHVAVYEVQVDNPVADFTAEDEGVLDGLWRWMGASSSKVVGQGVKLTGGSAGKASRLFQRSDLLAVVRRLLELPGEQRGVRLQGRRLRLERRTSGQVVDAADLERTFRSLLRAAALCGREQVELPKIRLRPKVGTFAWTGGGATALCPYCRDGLATDGDGAAACDRCGTAHHAACLEEAGGCTVFGCGGGREAEPVRS